MVYGLNNVMNDYGISDTQSSQADTIAGINFSAVSDNPGQTSSLTIGSVTAFANVHIRSNIIKCESGFNNKLTVRAEYMADSEISGNNLIACGGNNVYGENLATWGYHIGIETNDFWNSQLGPSGSTSLLNSYSCLLITQQDIAATSTAACPNGTCGTQGYAIWGNRFHDCGFSDISWTTTENGSIIADNSVSDNVGDDTGTGLSTYGFAFNNLPSSGTMGCSSTNGCNASIYRSHVHDNIWGDLPGTTTGNGVNINIGNQMGTSNAAVFYSSVITGGFDLWGNNSILNSGTVVQESGFIRRNLKDIYCATDQHLVGTVGDPSCDNYANPNMTANSDYGGVGTIPSTGPFTFTHTWTGTYSTAPVCTASDTSASPVVLQVVAGLTNVVVTAASGPRTINYTCELITSHN
jgi:hypothetical protein